ncbi:MAG: hypothetical protein FWG68_08780 [Defluviitaleaceae bacterium]|nr:hypothetical protein [Defluviitaleaceae bacterium]
MTIRCLLASSDKTYIQRLAAGLEKTATPSGDALEIVLFTDSEKMADALKSDSGKFHAAIVDEILAETAAKHVPIILALTDDNAKDGTKDENLLYVYKYQQISTIVRKLVMAQTSKRTHEGKGNGVICAFFSVAGGSGATTLSVAFALAAVKLGLRPLYVSFEHFNTTELFFRDTAASDQRLDDIFYIVAEGGGVATAIDVAKAVDSTGVAFLKPFATWTEIDQLQPNDIDIFIDATRSVKDSDLTILDMDSGVNPISKKILAAADEIFIITDSHALAHAKLRTLFAQNTPAHLKNATLIVNKNDGTTPFTDDLTKSKIFVPKVPTPSPAALEQYLQPLLKNYKRQQS